MARGNRLRVFREKRSERHAIKERLRRIRRAYGGRNQRIIVEWLKQAGKVTQAQIETSELVCLGSKTPLAGEMMNKIEEI
jgi:hypothetical protein